MPAPTPNESYTTGKLALDMPNTGSYVNVWGGPLAANWQVLDAAVSGTTILTLSNTDVVLTVPVYPASSNPAASPSNPIQNLRILLLGTLTANVQVILPAGVPGMWLIDNQTAGAPYVVTVKTATTGSFGVQPLRGYMSFVFTDGTNVAYADGGGAIANATTPGVPAGTILPFAGPVAATGYLLCNGAAYSRTTYSTLFAAIGTTWGAGDGSTTFNVPDLQNMFLRGAGTSAVGVYEADDFKSHTHTATVNDPGHNHTTAILASSNSIGNGDTVTGVTGSGYQTLGGALTTTKTTGVGVTNASTGGTETRPVNKRVLYIIKT